MILKLTNEQIESYRSPRGGFKKEAFEKMGIGYPPPKGWRRKLIKGIEIGTAREPTRMPDAEFELILEIARAVYETASPVRREALLEKINAAKASRAAGSAPVAEPPRWKDIGVIKTVGPPPANHNRFGEKLYDGEAPPWD